MTEREEREIVIIHSLRSDVKSGTVTDPGSGGWVPAMMKQVLILLMIVLAISSMGCVFGDTRKVKDADAYGQGVALIEEWDLDGVRQWVDVRGKSDDLPVVLWLAGGPGGSELGWTREYLWGLEEDCIFVNWEQAGTGMSFDAADVRELTVEDFVGYTITLTERLIERFGKDSIVLVGHSWGSIIGLMAVERRPDLYSAYVGLGQQVNALENDLYGYQLVMDEARERGETRVVKRLERQGEPPYPIGSGGDYTYLFQKVHVFSPRPAGVGDVTMRSMLFPEDYRLGDSWGLLRGLLRAVDYIYPQLADIDFEKSISRVEVPVFFPTGRYDYTCVQDITYRYYEGLEAPMKRFYWFESSGHNACYQEAEKFMKIMREDVLPLAQ